jgi:NAD(P)-dependent dehydrogenase (short-subunit alcohol dehydrogenase family)
MGQLAGKAAVVTGAASGIGEGIARRYASEGANVIIADIADIADGRGEAVAGELGDAAVFVHTDVSDGAQVKRAVDACIDRFGRLDIMVNNAGYGGVYGPIEAIDEDGWDDVYRILVKSVFLGCKYAVPRMRDAGGGSIINTASVAGILGGYGAHAYATAKAAVIHLSKSVALEVAPDAIRVNAISPGFIATPLATSTMTGTPEEVDEKAVKMRNALSGTQPLHKLGKPEDMANLALFLASDQSSFITGQNIAADGGLSTGRPVEAQPGFFFGRRRV